MHANNILALFQVRWESDGNGNGEGKSVVRVVGGAAGWVRATEQASMQVCTDMTVCMCARAHVLVQWSLVGVVGRAAGGQQGRQACVLTAHTLVLQLPVRVVGKVARWMKVVGKVAGG